MKLSKSENMELSKKKQTSKVVGFIPPECLERMYNYEVEWKRRKAQKRATKGNRRKASSSNGGHYPFKDALKTF